MKTKLPTEVAYSFRGLPTSSCNKTLVIPNLHIETACRLHFCFVDSLLIINAIHNCAR